MSCASLFLKKFHHPWSFRVEMIFARRIAISITYVESHTNCVPKDSARYSGNKWSRFAASAHMIGYCERIKKLDDVPERERRSNKGFQSALLVLNLCARISSVSRDTRRNIHETVMPTRYGIYNHVASRISEFR